MMQQLVTINGTSITLAAQIGKPGGEGTTYRLVHQPHLVAKIYHTPPGQSTIAKLAWMIAHPPAGATLASGSVVLAWPQALVKEKQSGEIRGFTMPLIDGSWEITRIADPVLRRSLKTSHGGPFRWHHLHEIACNLARVVDYCHAAGYVIGDLNNNNTRVSKTGQISLIDTDSFQVTSMSGGTTTVHYCTVGLPEYTPPELMGKDFSTTLRDSSADRFILAILIFRLLQDQLHPFTGKCAENPPPDPMTLMARGWYPYDTARVNQQVQPNSAAPPYGRLHPKLRELFQACFADGLTKPQQRPTAREWVDALLLARSSLQLCANKHYYSAHGPTNVCLARVGSANPITYCGATATSIGLKPIPAANLNLLTGQITSSKHTTVTVPPSAPRSSPPGPPSSSPPSTPVRGTPQRARTGIGSILVSPFKFVLRTISTSIDWIGSAVLRSRFVIVAVLAIMLTGAIMTGYAGQWVTTLRNEIPTSNLVGSSNGTTKNQTNGKISKSATTASAWQLLSTGRPGGMIVLSAFNGDTWSLNILDPDIKEPHALYTGLEIDPVPVWSTRGTQFAFVAAGQDGIDVRVVEQRSGQVTMAGHLAATNRVTRLTWNSEDTTLLISVTDQQGPHILSMSLGSGKSASFLPVSSINIAMSSQGETAYAVLEDGTKNIVQGDANGKACCYVARTSADESDPAFSPDGAMIAYDTSPNDEAQHTVVVKQESVLMRVPVPKEGPSRDSTIPTWTPTGDGVIFAYCVPTRCRIYLTRLTGNAQTSSLTILLSTGTITRIGSISWQPQPVLIQPSS